ncbi:MAG: ribosome recycling factor [Bacteroidales bacterium]|nr:ribosome recycling factor [Bacteroidales bacterium]MBR3412218.1 ribosome recycling factor [Bacteroidales bacterium]
MSDKEIQEFAEKLQQGLNIAERRMLEEKALRGQDIVVCHIDGTIHRVPANEAIKAL